MMGWMIVTKMIPYTDRTPEFGCGCTCSAVDFFIKKPQDLKFKVFGLLRFEHQSQYQQQKQQLKKCVAKRIPITIQEIRTIFLSTFFWGRVRLPLVARGGWGGGGGGEFRTVKNPIFNIFFLMDFNRDWFCIFQGRLVKFRPPSLIAQIIPISLLSHVIFC